MRGAMPDEESVLLLMGKTAMNNKSYLRQVPRIDLDTSLSLLRRRRRSQSKRPSAATNRSCASSLKCRSPLRPLVRKIVRLTTYHKRRLESTTSELFIFLD